jgi:hypothetical protein
VYCDRFEVGLVRISANTLRIMLFVAAVIAVVAVVFITGWAYDKAPPGSRGRVPVTYSSPKQSR